MKNLKENAAAMLLALFCAVFLVPSVMTSCTNGEDGTPTFTASKKNVKVPIEVHDTIWYPVHDSIYIDVIKKEGIKADGNPGLDYVNDETYRTYYPLIEDGEKIDVATNLSVWAKLLKSDDEIIEVSDSLIGNPSFKIGERSNKQRQDGDFTKLAFDAKWVYKWEGKVFLEGKGFSETVNTLHEMAWYKGWQMLSYYWTGAFKEIRYSIGKPYTHNEVEGKLFSDTLVWEFMYGQDDIRELTKVRKFFYVPSLIEPDPEAAEIFGKNFDFKTTSDSTAITSFEVWQRLNNGKTNMITNLSAGLKFWLVNAQGQVIDLSKDQEFSLSDLQAIEGSKKKVGEPRIIGSISIQEYVTTYTTKTDKSSSVFYGHTEEATLIIPEKLGGNIAFTAKDFTFADKGTSKLQNIADEANFERMEAFTRIVGVYHDRSLNGQGSIILRKMTDTPEKNPISYKEKSWDGQNSYIITIFYDDKTYEDIPVVDSESCVGSFDMSNGTKIYRDNTNFGEPTIAKKGEASTEGDAKVNGDITRQQMNQIMKASYDGYAHEFTYHYTSRTFAKFGLEPISLSVPQWVTTHLENKPGTVRNEVETEKNYQVTPMTFMYNGKFGKNNAESYSHAFEVWKFVSEVKNLISYTEQSFDGVNTYVIRHFYDDNTYEDLTVIDNQNCVGSLSMENGTKTYRDNTNFGKPTIARKGEASTEGAATTNENITRQQMNQPMKSSFDGYAHDFAYHYTARSYSKNNLPAISLTVPQWVTTHSENKPGTVRNEVETEKNYEVTPISFIYDGKYGKNEVSKYNHDFEVWKFVSEVLKVISIRGKDFGFDYVDARTSKTYFTAYNVMSDNSNVDLGTEEFFLNNYIENSARQIINTENFDVTTATAVAGSKAYQSERSVNGKWGKAIIKLYRTTYTTMTNKAQTSFFMYHEEAIYYPNKGEAFALLSKEYEAVDNGISPLENLGRKDGMDGKLYKSLVSFSFNNRDNQLFNEVELWVKTDNQNGIDVDWTNGYAGAVNFWDPSNTNHISMTGVYNNKDGVGGIKGFSDGKLVIKATWDEVNKPTGRLSVAQDAGGKWFICQVAETTDKKGWIWRSIMKGSENTPIRSIQKTQLQILGLTEVYINTTSTENADGTVTLTATNGSTITLGAW